MTLLQPTKNFLRFLHENPAIRSRISAPPNATFLYAGNFFKPVWQEIERQKFLNKELESKLTLPEVLLRIVIHGQNYPNLLSWAKALDDIEPWKQNGFIAWRALSGIYASNAVGTVSFSIGSGIAPKEKVFSVTELPVLIRNPNIDSTTRDILSYYQRCVQTNQSSINFGFIGK